MSKYLQLRSRFAKRCACGAETLKALASLVSENVNFILSDFLMEQIYFKPVKIACNSKVNFAHYTILQE